MAARDTAVLRFLAAPTDAGRTGTVDGGRVLEWIDKAAYACAVGWSRSYCVTAYVGNIHFDRPVSVGGMVEVAATIVYTGRTSMHIRVEVASADPREPGVTLKDTCLIIMVAVDQDGRPVPVPQWAPETEYERRQWTVTQRRIELRSTIEKLMAEQKYTDEGTAEETVLRFLAAPTDINWGGKVHGGTAMRWIDEAAYVCGAKWSGRPVIAVYAGGVRFYRPMHIGHLVEIRARLIHTAARGLHISVNVWSGDPATGQLKLTTNCLMVMVALDDEGRALPAKQWHPVSQEDKDLDAFAQELVRLRAEFPDSYRKIDPSVSLLPEA
jgi:acyl-CoA hydrolase